MHGPVRRWFDLAGLSDNVALCEAANDFDRLARSKLPGIEASVRVS